MALTADRRWCSRRSKVKTPRPMAWLPKEQSARGLGCAGVECQSGGSSCPSPSLPSLDSRLWAGGERGWASWSSGRALSSSGALSEDVLDLLPMWTKPAHQKAWSCCHWTKPAYQRIWTCCYWTKTTLLDSLDLLLLDQTNVSENLDLLPLDQTSI